MRSAKRIPSRSSLTSRFDASGAPSLCDRRVPCCSTGAAVERLAVDAASECVRGPQANASAPAHRSAMATRDGESDVEDIYPRQRTALSESAGAGEIGRSDPLSDRSGAQLNQVGDERSTTE